MKKIKLLLILFCLSPLLGLGQITLNASSSPSTCTAGNGTIDLSLIYGDIPVKISSSTVFGIAKSPYNEADIIRSVYASFTKVPAGDYFYGYFNDGVFIKSETTINVADNFNAILPSFENYGSNFYSYCGSSDPLSTIYATLEGTNNVPVELIDSNNVVVRQTYVFARVSFENITAGSYTLRGVDRCGREFFSPTIIVKPNIPYNDFTLNPVVLSSSKSYFKVDYRIPGNTCSPIVGATITNLINFLGLTISDITTPTGSDVPQYYGSKDPVYKIEVQDAASGTFRVNNYNAYQMSVIGGLYLSGDSSNWGVVRGSVTLCGVTKTNQIDLAQYREAEVLPLSFVSTLIYDDPTPGACVSPSKVNVLINTDNSGGCYPISVDVTPGGTFDVKTYKVVDNNLSFKLDIGKSYSIVIKDANGQKLPSYSFINNTTSLSSKPIQSNEARVYIDPIYFTPVPIRDKITFTDGPSSKDMGKSELVINNVTESLGLVGPIQIQSISGPSKINETFMPGSDTYYVSLGNNLLPGSYKIRVTDTKCFSADYDVELASYCISTDFVMPPNGGTTVDSFFSIVSPIVPEVIDNCGKTLKYSQPVISDISFCYGYVIYTSIFTDFNGNTYDWIYTYTIDSGTDFVMPANAGTTVACASSIVSPIVPEVIDHSGDILTPSNLVISAIPTCNGDVTYTYTFTDCKENTYDWIYTYTIDRAADFVMPANAGTTVACASSIVLPIVPEVTDHCGEILIPSSPVISSIPTCNGDVTYTYTFTDCNGNTHDWIYTYTIDRAADFVMPANGGTTVACASSIVLPIVPEVTDHCGEILIPSSPVISSIPTCNGDVTYTYTFTDCKGNTHDWIFTYTIDRAADFVMPANGGTTVACASSIVLPIVPEVTDHCGEILTPSKPVISSIPTCNGDVTYTYTFTDCKGNTHDWIYTYTIDRAADFVMPANGGTTVACASSIVLPIVPEVTDHCGEILIPSSPVISSIPTCNGDVTYTYTFTDCKGNTHDWIFTYTIDRAADFVMPANGGTTVACASSIVLPIVPEVTDHCGEILTPSKPVISSIPTCNGDVTYTYTFTDCKGNTHDWIYTYTIDRAADFVMPANGGTTVACASSIVLPIVPEVTDHCGEILTPSSPVISSIPTCNGDVTYTYTFTDCKGNTHDWIYTYTIDRAADFVMPANGGTTVACASSIVLPIVPEVTDHCGEILTPSSPVISSIPTCNGDVTYAYTFTDCKGNTHDWIYTYTIDRATDFVMPANGRTTVACASSIVLPIVPEVTDHCGEILTPSSPVISSIPTCNGDVTYTYTFTDCKGNTRDWIYTYTIDRATDFVMPANGGTTVACASSIVLPIVPEVTDHCGEILTPSSPVISSIPTCNGDVTYTYTFTDCKGNTHDWIYTYTIDRATDFVMPANGRTTVACASSIVLPIVPEVTDHCGKILAPSNPVISAIPTCNGDVTYTYTFTDCKGNTHDWIFTYTIDNVVAPTGTVPANLFFQCIEDVPIANVNDVMNAKTNCSGAALKITVLETNNGGTGCAKNPYIVIRTYCITDCSGLSTNLVQTISVADTTAPVFTEVLPANITVNCSATIPSAVMLTASDNCSTAIVTYNEVRVNGICSGNYQLQRTWIANDNCGNETIHRQVVKVVDTSAPVFIEPLPPAIVDANCKTIPLSMTLTATDNCGTPKVEYTERRVDGYCSSKYELLRTWIARDDCGNENTHMQTINVSCMAEVHNAISPNGDGMNDAFKIEGINCFPNNSVEIFNRYGVPVYKKDNYDNVTNPFEGVSDGRGIFKRGEKLERGTYFYILRYDDNGNRVEKSGYLYINN